MFIVCLPHQHTHTHTTVISICTGTLTVLLLYPWPLHQSVALSRCLRGTHLPHSLRFHVGRPPLADTLVSGPIVCIFQGVGLIYQKNLRPEGLGFLVPSFFLCCPRLCEAVIVRRCSVLQTQVSSWETSPRSPWDMGRASMWRTPQLRVPSTALGRREGARVPFVWLPKLPTAGAQ